jgi:hypothetical protein
VDLGRRHTWHAQWRHCQWQHTWLCVSVTASIAAALLRTPPTTQKMWQSCARVWASLLSLSKRRPLTKCWQQWSVSARASERVESPSSSTLVRGCTTLMGVEHLRTHARGKWDAGAHRARVCAAGIWPLTLGATCSCRSRRAGKRPELPHPGRGS